MISSVVLILLGTRIVFAGFCEENPPGLIDAISYMLDKGYDIEEVISTAETTVNFHNHDNPYIFTHFLSGGGTQMSPNDVLVWPGCTPPEVTYFALTNYLSIKINSLGATGFDYDVLGASLGDSQNHLSMRTRKTPTAPFDSWAVNVVTGDWNGYENVRESFAKFHLIPDSELNLLRIPQQYFLFSDSETEYPRAVMTLILRIANIELNQTAAQIASLHNYRNVSHPMYLFRKPSTAQETQFMQPDLRSRYVSRFDKESNVINRYFFNRAVDKITDYYLDSVLPGGWSWKLVSNNPFLAEVGTVNGHTKYIFDYGYKCIEDGNYCLFDNRDTLYSWDARPYNLTADDLYVVIGYNHDKFGLSVYNSLSLYYVNGRDGDIFQRIENGFMGNEKYEQYSIADIINGDSWIDRRKYRKTFMIQIARSQNCADTHLIASLCNITSDILFDDEEFIFFGRATLNPKTKTAPHPSQLIDWRLLHFVKHFPTSTTSTTTIETTDSPSRNPSVSPSRNPSASPTANPSVKPSFNPSVSPSAYHSRSPTTTTAAPVSTSTISPKPTMTSKPTTRPSTTTSTTTTTTTTTTSSPSTAPSDKDSDSDSDSSSSEIVTRSPSKSPSKQPSKSPTEPDSESDSKSGSKSGSKKPASKESKRSKRRKRKKKKAGSRSDSSSGRRW